MCAVAQRPGEGMRAPGAGPWVVVTERGSSRRGGRGDSSSPAPSILYTGLLESGHTASQPLAFALWIKTHCFLGEVKC